ncbi:hypothetical protein [Brevundimonas sp.]|uniref:hypothetical protein n=1 Tax=Brevundimonas sp. TaxID=1871086 RepID=UPI003AF758A7
MSETQPEDRYLKPGTPVRLSYYAGEDLDAELTHEDGVVAHCWWDDELGGHDCYVAFFGDAIPSGKPEDTPYILRYAATSLTVLDVADPLAAPAWAVKEDERAREEDRAEQSRGNHHLWTLAFVAIPPLIGLVWKLFS